MKISLSWNDDNENISLVLTTINRKTYVLTKANAIYQHIVKSMNTHPPQSDVAGWLTPNRHSVQQYICFTIKNNSREDVNDFPPAPQNVLSTSQAESEQALQQQQSLGSGWGRGDEDRNEMVGTYDTELAMLGITLSWYITFYRKEIRNIENVTKSKRFRKRSGEVHCSTATALQRCHTLKLSCSPIYPGPIKVQLLFTGLIFYNRNKQMKKP